MTNVLDEAKADKLALPLTQEVRDRFKARDEMDGGDLDHSALYLELLARNGISSKMTGLSASSFASAVLVAIDWGTSNLRLWVMDDKGDVLAEAFLIKACHN